MEWIIVIISLVVCGVALDFCIKDRKSELVHMEYLSKLDLLDNRIKQLKLELNSSDYIVLKDFQVRTRYRKLHYILERLEKERSLFIYEYYKSGNIGRVYNRSSLLDD